MEDAFSMLESCWKKIKLAKSNMSKHILQLGEIDEMFVKITKITKRKIESLTVVVTSDLLSSLVTELQQLQNLHGQTNNQLKQTNNPDKYKNSTGSDNEDD
jgi:hypothetical protein